MSDFVPEPTLPSDFVAPADLRVAVIRARFNAHIVDALFEGLTAQFAARGVAQGAVHVADVPGAWELPVACAWAARRGQYEAIVALGAVIRGDTPHFDFIARGAAEGCMRVSIDAAVPVVFGVLTTDTEEQAIVRALPSAQNKGRDFAEAALEMAVLGRRLGVVVPHRPSRI